MESARLDALEPVQRAQSLHGRVEARAKEIETRVKDYKDAEEALATAQKKLKAAKQAVAISQGALELAKKNAQKADMLPKNVKGDALADAVKDMFQQAPQQDQERLKPALEELCKLLATITPPPKEQPTPPTQPAPTVPDPPDADPTPADMELDAQYESLATRAFREHEERTKAVKRAAEDPASQTNKKGR